MEDARGPNVRIAGLDVLSKSGERILDNLTIDLEPSSLVCLLGKSGSGKSCLLGVLSRQLRSALRVRYVDGTDLTQIPCAYMRQQDMGMESMTPNDYLRATAKVYDTPGDRLEFVLSLARPFFPVRKDDDGDVVLDPFNNAPIGQLSGGQRRMVSIATTLFKPSGLLLLDEPLSGVDSASGERIVELLRTIAKENSMTVLMTLHQPSDDILSKVDKIVIMGEGRILFDGEFDHAPVPAAGRAAAEAEVNDDDDRRKDLRRLKSAAETVHQILVTSTVNASSRDLFKERVPEGGESLATRDGNDSGAAGTGDELGRPMARLRQVLPLLQRQHAECPPTRQDILVLPVVFLIVSLWGVFDSENPVQRFIVTMGIAYVPGILFTFRLVMSWKLFHYHIWDLEDKRISPLAYLISSGVHLLYIPILSVLVSYTIVYGLLGWPFATFWDFFLFGAMTTVATLQVGKVFILLCDSYEAVDNAVSVYSYLGFVVSGSIVNPAKIPSYLHWIMWLSLPFWGISGSQLTQLQLAMSGEEECLTIVSCIVLNKNFIAWATGFTTVTTAQLSMVALLVATIVLVLIEYFVLLRKVQPRGNYEKVESHKVDIASTLICNSLSSTEGRVDNRRLSLDEVQLITEGRVDNRRLSLDEVQLITGGRVDKRRLSLDEVQLITEGRVGNRRLSLDEVQLITEARVKRGSLGSSDGRQSDLEAIIRSFRGLDAGPHQQGTDVAGDETAEAPRSERRGSQMLSRRGSLLGMDIAEEAEATFEADNEDVGQDESGAPLTGSEEA